MIETLADLQRLRLQLVDATAKLMHAAETAPGSSAALAFTRLAADCQKLSREIELLSKDILTDQSPSGVA